MGYKVQFETGHIVEFDSQPSQQDIDEAFAHVSKQPSKTQASKPIINLPEIGKTIAGVGETAMSLLAPLPSQIAGGLYGASTLAATGGDIDKANAALQGTMKSNFGFGAYEPYTEKGKKYAEKTGEALQVPIELAGKAGEAVGGDIGRLSGEVMAGTAMALIDPLIGFKGAKALINKAGKSKSTGPNLKGIDEGTKPQVASEQPTQPSGQGSEYAQLQQTKQRLLNSTKPEDKAALAAIEQRLIELNTAAYTQRVRGNQLGFQGDLANVGDALNSFDALKEKTGTMEQRMLNDANATSEQMRIGEQTTAELGNLKEQQEFDNRMQAAQAAEQQRQQAAQAAVDLRNQSLAQEVNEKVTSPVDLNMRALEEQRQRNLQQAATDPNATHSELAQRWLDQKRQLEEGKAELARRQEAQAAAEKAAQEQAAQQKAHEEKLAAIEQDRQAREQQALLEMQQRVTLERGANTLAKKDSTPSPLHQRWVEQNRLLEEGKATLAQRMQEAKNAAERQQIAEQQARLVEQERAARAAAADEAARQRQTNMELDVKRQTVLGQGAADLAKTGIPPTPEALKAAATHPDVVAAAKKVTNAEASLQRAVEGANAKGIKTARTKLNNAKADLEATRNRIAQGPKTEGLFDNSGIFEMGSGLTPPKALRDWLNGVLFDWKKEPQVDQLRKIPGISEGLKGWTPIKMTNEEFLTHFKDASDVSQNLLQKGFNHLTKGGVYQSLKTGNPLIQRVVDTMLGADHRVKAAVSDMIHERLSPLAKDMSKTEKAEVWSAQQIAEKNGGALTRELMEQNGFNEKQIAWVEAHTEIMKDMYQRMSEAQKAAGLEPVSARVAYVAARSRGDFRRLVMNDKDQIVGVLGAKTRWGLNKDVKRLTELHPEYKIGEERFFGGGSKKGGTAEGFQQMLDFLSKNDPDVKLFVEHVNDMLTKDAYEYMNVKAHTMQKKGVFGTEGNHILKSMEQNAIDGMEAQMRYVESMIKWSELSKAVEEVKPLLKADNGLNMPKAKEWADGYIHSALGDNPYEVGRKLEDAFATMGKSSGLGTTIPSKVMSGVRSGVNGVLLGFVNIPFLTVNLLQPFASNLAMMAYLKAQGVKKGFDAGTGYSYLAKAGMDMMRTDPSPVIKGALEHAEKNHVYSSDLFEHGTSASKDFGHYWSKATEVGPTQVEQVTRKMVYLSYVNMLHENGLSPAKGLYETAQKLTDAQMNNYSTLESPKVYQLGGSVTRPAYNLMSYKHNELSRLAMFIREIPKTGSFMPALMHIATSIAFAGLIGTIGYAEANEIVKLISEKMGKPTTLTKLLLDNPEISEKLTHGTLGSMAGVDLSSRLGTGSLVPEHAIDAVMPGAGKLVNIAKAGHAAITNPNEYNAKNLVREMAPGSLGGILDRTWFSKDVNGKELAVAHPIGDQGSPHVTAVRNDADKLFKSIGATGINESKQKALTWENKVVDKVFADHRSKEITNMHRELFTKGAVDPKTVESYIKWQGTPETLTRDLLAAGKAQNIPDYQLQQLHDVASRSLTAKQRAARNVRN